MSIMRKVRQQRDVLIKDIDKGNLRERMDHSKKLSMIVGSCILLIAAVSSVVLYKTFRPSQGLPYEEITMEQLMEYMEYEAGYVLLDVRTKEEYRAGHIAGALNIPIDELNSLACEMLPDKEQMIYVYGKSGNRSRKAAAQLCKMGYVNISEVGEMQDWTGETETGDE